ncbi:NUDIX domain-containing protein [uncultured Microbacterium sp.]|uniref:NUDIX hydrolase n=1 Tax=uncultured Microbacterium sp. TaxID=191216 RepID=UPI0028D40BE1|nr:NUDIX domain-containing protein [uncultured Microbacterium sp.]
MSAPDDVPVAGTVVLLRPGESGVEVLLIRRPGHGSFAGAWVFPGGKVEEADRASAASEQDDARRAGVRETAEEVGLAVTGPMRSLSCWQPPVEAPVRIRTWFFLASAPDSPLRLASGEVEEAAWITPSAALQRHGSGEWTLFPPTWMTLHRLSGYATVSAALGAAGATETYATRIERTAAGTSYVWESLRLDTGTLPWRVSRRDGDA